MQVLKNQPLAGYTSFGVGGNADNLVLVENTDNIAKILENYPVVNIIGYGTNYLISDHDLPGLTVVMRTKSIVFDDDAQQVIAESGVWWDDLVQGCVKKDLWGLELTSGIPGGVGGAVVGNIAAYGQSVADSLTWVDVLDTTSTSEIKRLTSKDLNFGYRYSTLQHQESQNLLILGAAFNLSTKPTQPMSYQKALDVANELGLDENNLVQRRQIVMEARRRAGSLLPKNDTHSNTAGSFFKNPLVTQDQAETVMRHEEFGVSTKQILHSNMSHGGDKLRMSAALVLLAAGFKRGQTWGKVGLHKDNLLKVENLGGATAQQIYDVGQHLKTTVKEKLNINLDMEVRLLGKFNN